MKLNNIILFSLRMNIPIAQEVTDANNYLWDDNIPTAIAIPVYENQTLMSKEDWPLVKVYGIDFREHLIDMYQTVCKLELWEWFKTEEPPEGEGYMFWCIKEKGPDGEIIYKKHPNIVAISKNLKNNDHSGGTFSYAMRCMQCIAKKGFESWKRDQK